MFKRGLKHAIVNLLKGMDYWSETEGVSLYGELDYIAFT